MDYLRQGIHLRGYAQKDPKQEYKREAFTMFNDMLARFKHEVTSMLARVQIQTEAEVQAIEERRRAKETRPLQFQHEDAPDAMHGPAPAQPAAVAVAAAASPVGAGGPRPATAGAAQQAQPTRTLVPAEAVARPATVVRDGRKVGRNDPCPCGSGQKYKNCHGKLA
jgi:preprotein translocase subunit SecA